MIGKSTVPENTFPKFDQWNLNSYCLSPKIGFSPTPSMAFSFQPCFFLNCKPGYPYPGQYVTTRVVFFIGGYAAAGQGNSCGFPWSRRLWLRSWLLLFLFLLVVVETKTVAPT